MLFEVVTLDLHYMTDRQEQLFELISLYDSDFSWSLSDSAPSPA